RELARQMGIPEGTILARAKREGWTREIQNSNTLVKREDTPLAVTPVEAVAMSMQKRGERHTERMAGSQSAPLITLKRWTAQKSSHPWIKSRKSTRLRAGRLGWTKIHYPPGLR